MILKTKLPDNEQKEYYLLENMVTNYKSKYGWEPGMKLIRVSQWFLYTGCVIRQAWFVPADSSNHDEHIVWEDHVKPVLGQMELF